jgi:hypothetical protein
MSAPYIGSRDVIPDVRRSRCYGYDFHLRRRWGFFYDNRLRLGRRSLFIDCAAG